MRFMPENIDKQVHDVIFSDIRLDQMHAAIMEIFKSLTNEIALLRAADDDLRGQLTSTRKAYEAVLKK